MKKIFAKSVAVLAVALFSNVYLAAQERKAWADVAAPTITGVEKISETEYKISFNCLTNNDGADEGLVVAKSESGVTVKKVFGKTRKEAKTSTLQFERTGNYSVVVQAMRKDEAEVHNSEPKTINFKLDLAKTKLTALNIGDSTIKVTWDSVPEAEGYILSYTDESGKTVSNPVTTELSANLQLKAGTKSTLMVTTIRGSDKSVSAPIQKTVAKDAERIWRFTEFGTSTNPNRNNMEMIDADNLKVKLNSCTFDPKTKNIIDKGGKFETFFDGISFYYTVIDPHKENFELTATVTVDYHNPMADGQEGFGLLAIDRLGIEGNPMEIAYNNSAAILSKKFTTHVNGAKKEIKNGLGSRFVSGITDAIIQEGTVSQKALNVSKAFSYDQSSDAIKTGDVYRITLKKDNTGYHAIYKKAIASEDTVEEFIMYDNENEKLVQLDKEHIYVGFAVARGCNATFSDVDFKVIDPQKDAPAIPEPPTLVPLTTLIDSPSTWYEAKYPFVFTANSNGTIHIEDNDGKVYVKADKVTANDDYKKTLKFKLDGGRGITDLHVTFDPEDGWRPSPKEVIAQFNSDINVNDYEENYKPVTYMHSVAVVPFKGKELHVSQKGTIFGTGTKDDPIDLDSAIKYAKPGQTILLAPGKYYPSGNILIERGNDGTKKARKTLKSEEANNRAIIDFTGSKATVSAFQLYGSWWIIENIDITGTPDDCKAIQIAGNYNEIRMVDTYLNGDTGIQISGRASEPPAKWPHHNLIYGCESFGNCDPAQNNADGFASKLTSGEGNIFRNCVAHHNVDDGWDLYAKIETGPIGAVILENCIAYNNGRKIDNTGKGDGNGFKLGGDGIAVQHRIVNSISFNNDLNGITTNSNPALIVENCTAFANKMANLNLYGKGKAEQYPRTIQATGNLSLNGLGRDKFDDDNDPSLRPRLVSDDNFFCDGEESVNKSRARLDEGSFVSVDFAKIANGLKEDGKTFNRLPRSSDGVFDLGDLFKLTEKVPAGVGADYNYKVRGTGKKK